MSLIVLNIDLLLFISTVYRTSLMYDVRMYVHTGVNVIHSSIRSWRRRTFVIL